MTAMTRPFQRALDECCEINSFYVIVKNDFLQFYKKMTLGDTISAYVVRLQIITEVVYKMETYFLWLPSSFVMY